MSQENVEVARYPVALGTTSRRRLVEHLGLRFPRLLARLSRVVLRLPQRSRVKRTMVRYATRLALDAANRGDYEAAFVLYHPDGHASFREATTLGFEPPRNREERIAVQRAWVAEMGEFQNDPDELIDLGDRLLLLVHLRGSGLSSGAGFNNECGYLLTFLDGRVISEDLFLSHNEALEAAGLRE